MLERTVYQTLARRKISDLLRTQRRYLTAAAIHRLLREDSTQLALSTVYRTLEMLVATGVASSRTDATGEASYVWCRDGHHHHAICRTCGHVDDVSCSAVEEFRAALLAEQSFALDDHSVEFYGRCAACR